MSAQVTSNPASRSSCQRVARARARGLDLQAPADAVALVEEMLASLLQCALDGGAASNLPRVSQGALVLLRALDRPDAREVMAWLYDQGPDRLRVFGINNFFPDGTPPESTGGYNCIHSAGLFALEYHLRHLRQARPESCPEAEFSSLMADPRAARVARAPHEITMIGRTHFQFGDGGGAPQPGRFPADLYPAPLPLETLEQAADFTGDEEVAALRDAVGNRAYRRLGPTVHDGVGIAILRTPEEPERAAAGIVYGDTTGHRHMDLLDVQLFAFDRPFLTDLGYPQSWASKEKWEAHWATHNSVWGVVPGLDSGSTAGRGRLVRTLFVEGVQILDIEAERWALDGQRWYRPGVAFRRLLALVETDGEGVALVDLARIRGGSEHWRTCRGLEGDFVSTEVEQHPRPGTMAGENGQRGQLDDLAHPDHAALACMDEVAIFDPKPSWKGRWVFRREEGVYLDLHQLRASAAIQTSSARATAIMGTPAESTYGFRTLLWHGRPSSPDETTGIDLVFEPRVGPATIASARSIAADQATASGVELRTAAGRQIRIYWAPDAGPDDQTLFADNTRLWGGLAVATDGGVTAAGATALELAGKTATVPDAVQTGTIIALDRRACTIDVEGLTRIAAGDRIRVNPEGRGHTYRVESAERLDPGPCRLRLDLTSLLGRARVAALAAEKVELDFHIMARTGNLHQTRLQLEATGEWAEIAAAANPDPGRTVVHLQETLAKKLKRKEWVSVVDYAVGDQVLCEPARTLEFADF